MIWLCISLLGRVAFAVCNILDSHFRNAKFTSPYSQTYFFNLFILILLPIYPLFWEIKPLPQNLVIWLLVGGVTFFLYVIPYLESLKIADASTVVSLFTLGRIFVPILAWILIGEKLSYREIIGFVIVLFGALWHAYEPSKTRLNSRLILLMLASGLMIAIYSVCSKKIFNEIGCASGVFYFFLMDCLISLSLLVVPKLRVELIETTRRFPKLALSYSPVVISALLGNIFVFWAISLTKVSYVAMTAQFQALIALFLSMIMGKVIKLQNKESFTRQSIVQKLFGFVIMATGMVVALEY